MRRSDIDLIESLSTTRSGGVDTITTLGGNDIVIGGRFGDTINAGDGDNLVIGDSGRITAASAGAPQFSGVPMTLGLIETIEYADGGVGHRDHGQRRGHRPRRCRRRRHPHGRRTTTSCTATTRW